ncbi:(Fe-S)-binding protein [Aquabacter spiritensis]|uniref:Fe-S oxidoreductase n=1 Tax=Aquabacter spiritensis TaxID=933073 RepID=A0A4R3LVN5_9HYPH|nr:(Fe-S)-binding protein [Aquabacter spiritensis]TCT04624.1 Fe-S oxidoreductase [Aquabacter spiritensis]
MSAAGFADALSARTADILDRCTRCARCFEICPMTGPAGLAAADPEATVTGVLGLISGGSSTPEAERWATACSGSGTCIPACNDGVNPRFMLALGKLALARRAEDAVRRAKGNASFRTMSRGVKILSRIQMAPDTLARFEREEPAPEAVEVVFYTGCNLLKTPHIALLCFDILDRIGVSYAVMGGPGDCCGVLQFRTGDIEGSGRIAYRTTDRFGRFKASTVLSWCPTCQVQIAENVLPGRWTQSIGGLGYELEAFVVFLDRHLDRLRPHLSKVVNKRVGLHEHPGVAGVAAAAERILKAVPGLDFVDLAQPSVGWMCNTLQPLPAYKRSLHSDLLEAAAAAGVTTLAGVYHACHRELCTHQRDWPFEIVNFLELVGESMGIAHEDHFKRLKMMQDVEAVLADVADLAALHGLRTEEVREVILDALLSEQPLPLRAPAGDPGLHRPD